MSKYKEFYEMMITQNKAAFDEFKKVHAAFIKNPKKGKEQFNRLGSDILDIVREYENRLCRGSESAGNSKFTTALAEKFQTEIKSHFPKINLIGLE